MLRAHEIGREDLEHSINCLKLILPASSFGHGLAALLHSGHEAADIPVGDVADSLFNMGPEVQGIQVA